METARELAKEPVAVMGASSTPTVGVEMGAWGRRI